jgi:hypothetical protein
MPGPPRLPPKLKSIRGTARPSRDNAILGAPVAELPAPPAWIKNPAAIAEWYRLAGILVPLKVLTEPALNLLAHACALHGALVDQWAAGQLPAAHHMAQLRYMLKDLGVSYGNISCEHGAKPNRFSKNGRRPS